MVATRSRSTAGKARPSGRAKAPTELRTSLHRNWLIYSDSGIGKTVLLGTAPNACFVSAEEAGAESAKVHGSTAKEWLAPTWEDYEDALEYFRDGPGCQKHDWVLIDSLTELEQLCWGKVLREGKAKNPARRLDKPAKEDYQIVYNRVLQIVEDWNRLPINVAYAAGLMQIDFTDEEDNELIQFLPSVGSNKHGKQARQICAKVGLVGRLILKGEEEEEEDENSDDTKRRLILSSTGATMAKNRARLGRYMDEPTIPKLLRRTAKRLGEN